MNMQDQTTILIVEDQEITRLGLKMSLELMPQFKLVGEASDGQTAVRMAEELKPQVVLMDIGLPVMDGIQASEQIKKSCADTRILVLTTRDGDHDIFAAFAAGADGYCLKEAPLQRIVMAIGVVADGSGYLDPSIAGRILPQLKNQKATKQEGSGAQQLHEPLSQREHEVLALIVDGMTNVEIAEKLVLSPETIKSHVRRVFEKLAVSDRTQAAVKAMRSGLI